MKKIKVLSKFLGILSTFMLICLPFSAMESEDPNNQPSKNINKESLEKPIENVDNKQSENKLNDIYKEKDIQNDKEKNVEALEQKLIDLIREKMGVIVHGVENFLYHNFDGYKKTDPDFYVLKLEETIDYFENDRPIFIEKYGKYVEMKFFVENKLHHICCEEFWIDYYNEFKDEIDRKVNMELYGDLEM